MKQMIDACREIVKLANEIRTNQNIPYVLGDSISERLYAVRGLLEAIPLNDPRKNPEARNPWRKIDDTDGLADCTVLMREADGSFDVGNIEDREVRLRPGAHAYHKTSRQAKDNYYTHFMVVPEGWNENVD